MFTNPLSAHSPTASIGVRSVDEQPVVQIVMQKKKMGGKVHIAVQPAQWVLLHLFL